VAYSALVEVFGSKFSVVAKVVLPKADVDAIRAFAAARIPTGIFWG
jgi:hypothetical protein